MKVFIATPSDDAQTYSDVLHHTLLRAGMEVIHSGCLPDDELGFIKGVKEGVGKANCSIHILGSGYGKTLEINPELSISKFQFKEARKKVESGAEQFKMFIWYPPEILAMEKEPLQEQFITEVRNSILKNMVFTNADSPIRFVDDIRTLMTFDQKTKFEIKEAEIFLIFNELDEPQAEGIIDMLSDIITPIEKLNIIQNSDMDYSEYCLQQIGASKLVTIFFKDTAEWALPFTQQIWKKAGGASSKTPILLIGTDEPENNINKKFNAPKVISLIISGELIPLEIKVQYDSVLEKA